jgi:hypothetical protein
MASEKPKKPEQTALSALNNSDFSTTIQRARYLEALNQDLCRSLPDALAKQCRLVVSETGILVFHVSNSVWKNKLRLHSQELLANANALGLHAREIRIKIDPAFKPNEA